MQDNDFWIGQEQIPVDLSLLLTYSNDEDYRLARTDTRNTLQKRCDQNALRILLVHRIRERKLAGLHASFECCIAPASLYGKL